MTQVGAVQLRSVALKYEALTWSGEKVKGVLNTDSEEVACEMLHEEALIPWRLTPAKTGLSLEAVIPRLFPPSTLPRSRDSET